MGIIGKIIGLAATITGAAVAGSAITNKVKSKHKKELAEIESKNAKELANLNHQNNKEMAQINHKNTMEEMTHSAKLQKSNFDKSGNLIYTEQCKHCGNQISINSKYCNFCGNVLKLEMAKCGNCNSSIPKNSKFCNFCGVKFKQD